MNSPTSAAPIAAVPEVVEGSIAPVAASEIDASCRWPVLFMTIASVKWLVFGIVLGVISSIKLHAPNFLTECPLLTYGRVRPAFLDILVFGFAAQAGLAIGLWLLARLGRMVLQAPLVISVAAWFWNIGVAVGVIGILLGDTTGYEFLEFPRYATPILFFAYALIGICAVLTFHLRRERETYPSQWYILGALLWFPWVYSVAQLLLVHRSLRGALQGAISGWASHNLFSLWLTPLGLAAIFYFLSKLTGRPLYSRSLAVFGFWLLALFGAFGGVPTGTPVPKWISSLSVMGSVMSVMAVLAVACNWHLTLAGAYSRWKSDVPFRFVACGAASYLLASGFQIIGNLRPVSEVTQFTLYSSGVTQLYLYGFLGMTVCGALYYVLCKVTDVDWPSSELTRFHFWTATIGTALVSLPLIGGGVLQGLKLNASTEAFLEVVRITKPFLGLSTLGGVLLLAGAIALSINLGCLACATCCRWCCGGEPGSSEKAGRKRA